MKVRKAVPLLVAGLLAALPSLAQDLTLDEVLAKYYEAVGGLEQLKATKSVRFTGTMSMGQGMEVPVTMVAKRPMKARLEFTVQGMTGIQAYDGETAWMVMPFMGKTDPEVMPEDQAKDMKQQADIDGPLVDWKEKGHELELVGMEEVEGTEAYKIRVALANGDVQYHYLDSEYFVPIKIEGKREVQGNEVEFETTLGDYKEVGGLLFPHYIESRPKGAPSGQVITIDSIELNEEIDDATFTMPAAEGGEG